MLKRLAPNDADFHSVVKVCYHSERTTLNAFKINKKHAFQTLLHAKTTDAKRRRFSSSGKILLSYRELTFLHLC